jgi:chromosome segregation ATPase
MWKRCGRFWAVFLLCLLVSSLAFSEGLERVYYLTETQMIQLEAIFETLKTENEKLRTSLDESAKEVVALRKDSIQLQDTLKEARNSLTRAEESLRTYAADMNKTLLTERTKKVVYTILGVAAGGLAGYVIGQF